MLNNKPLTAPAWRGAMLTALALSLIGCATTSPQPEPMPCPAVPAPPVTAEPLPQSTYSLSAAQLIKAWRERLTATRETSAP